MPIERNLVKFKVRNCFLIAVGGARGVGKTTILGNLVSNNPDLRVISLGEELNAVSIEKFGRRFFDLKIEEKDDIRKIHGAYLIKSINREPGTFFLDLHYTDIREGAGKIIQPKIILQKINIFAYFDADSASILQRIINSAKRERIQSISYIEKDKMSEMTAAIKLSEIYKKPFFRLNTDRPIEETNLELHIFLEKTFNSIRGGKERI